MNMHKNNKSFHFNTNPFGCIGSFCLTTLMGGTIHPNQHTLHISRINLQVCTGSLMWVTTCYYLGHHILQSSKLSEFVISGHCPSLMDSQNLI